MGAAASLTSGLEAASAPQYPYSGLDQSAYLNVLQNAAYSQGLQQNAGLLAQMKKSGYDVWSMSNQRVKFSIHIVSIKTSQRSTHHWIIDI